MKIVFMGTPDFAVQSLKAIYDSPHEIGAIVTVPDKKKGRGQKIQASAVKKFAVENNLTPVLQPERLKNPEFLTQLKQINADLFVVVAFRILPEDVFNMPPLGTVNLHASLLPDYRGAAPINWAIINGEKETGVTTFFIKKEVDTGSILLQRRVLIEEQDNAGTLHDKLAVTGAQLLVETLNGIENKTLTASVQPEGEFKTAPKIFPKTAQINWSQPARDIYNFIRGLSPYPGATTLWNEKKIKIFNTSIVHQRTENRPEPGHIVIADKKNLCVQTMDHLICIEELQMPGKKRISVEEALRGYNFREGDRFING